MSAPNHRLFDTGKGKAPVEKSNFVQTCNRLSLFLKEKGNLQDLSFGKFDPNGLSDKITQTITPVSTPTSVSTSTPVLAPATTLVPTHAEAMTYNLLDNMEHKKVSKVDKVVKRVRFLPQLIILDEEEPKDSSNKASSSKPKTAQMTIFYDGKVVVLDDVPEDRAKTMMSEASGKIEKPVQQVELPSTSKVEMKDSDLPIARRASLNKFLAKRKERAIVRAPYQAHNMDINMNMSPGASSEHSFDLNM